MSLPFLKQRMFPKIAKPINEVRYGYSEQEQIKEDCLKELIAAYDSKNVKAFMEALEALILICSQENEEE